MIPMKKAVMAETYGNLCHSFIKYICVCYSMRQEHFKQSTDYQKAANFDE